MRRAQRKVRIRNIANLKHHSAEISELTNKKYGKFFDIKINRRENPTLMKYLRVLIHELLHLAFFTLEGAFSKKYTGQSEHEYIRLMTDAALLHFEVLKEKQ